MSRAFACIDFDLVDAEGWHVAVIYDAFRWHADRRPWVATIEQIMDVSRLGRKPVQTAIRRLRELGMIESRNAEFGTRTQSWSLITKAPEGAHNGPDGAFAPITDLPDQLHAADADESEQEQTMNDPTPVVAGVDELNGTLVYAEVWPEEASVNGCRAAWLEAHTAHHGRPDPTIKRQALGRIKQAAADRETLDDWRALWRACHAAGAAGQFNVQSFLGAAPARRGPHWNENTALRLLNESQTSPPFGILTGGGA